jgi:hypothetical protein
MFFPSVGDVLLPVTRAHDICGVVRIATINAGVVQHSNTAIIFNNIIKVMRFTRLAYHTRETKYTFVSHLPHTCFTENSTSPQTHHLRMLRPR